MYHSADSADAYFDLPGENLTISVTLDGHFEGATTFQSQPFHVARVALDAIPVGQTEPLPEEDKNDPGAWILARRDAQSPEPAAKATLIVRPTEVSSLTRRLTWNNNLLIVRNKATGILVSSGVTLSEDEGPVEFTVAGTENFAAGGEATVTLTVRKPNNATLATDKVKFIRPNVTVAWESRHGPGLLEEFSVSEYDNEFTTLDLEWLNGWRYFPCAAEPGGTIRNIVDVKVNMPGYGGKTVRLRAFDVDDATPLEFDLEGVIDEQKGRGNDNGDPLHLRWIRGKFIDTMMDRITLVLDSNGEATTRFRVSSRPGANYRISAVLDGFQNRLTALQVDTDANPDYVPNGDAQLDDIIPGGISPTLTIWRKLHLEVDSMEEVPEEGPEKNQYTGTITGFGGVRPEGYTTLSLSSVPGVENRFQAGRLTLDGSDYFIRSSTLPSTYIFFQEGFQQTIDAKVEIVGILDSSVKGMNYTLKDDDDLHRNEIDLHPALPYDEHSGEIVAAIRRKFAPAFVDVIDGNALGLNPNPRISFRLHGRVWGGAWENLASLGNTKDLRDENAFWAHTLVVAYQPVVNQSLDPDEPDADRLFGITPKQPFISGFTSHGYSVVFIELFRDYALGGSRSVNFPWAPESIDVAHRNILSGFYGVISHEIAHAPGNQSGDGDHQEGELMRGTMEEFGPPTMVESFAPLSILRFRSSMRWGD